MIGGRAGLLLSSSAAALLVGGGAPAAFAACANGAGAGAGFDNPAAHTTACVVVANTSFAGNITNEGTIAPGGVSFTSGTMSGFLASSGNIAGGLTLDNKSTINNAFGTAISLTSSTFFGGISNAGLISAGGRAINVSTSTFGGGIGNSGTISANSGIIVQQFGTFQGGISNRGAILLTGGGSGISVFSGTAFSGPISNSGTISASNGIGVGSVALASGGITNSGILAATNDGIFVSNVSTFAGAITNSGTLSGRFGTVFVSTVNVFGSASAGGGIVNSGTITAASGFGIRALNVATFQGGITNIGQISAGAASTGILVTGGATFQGGIFNGGTLSAGAAGIKVSNPATFLGGISNSGVISAGGSGIAVTGVASFQGGVSNGGTISAAIGGAGSGIFLNNITTFTDGVTNTGRITAASAAINLHGVTSFAGGITNSGTLSASGGISVQTFNTFQGGITNRGTVLAASGSGIGVSSGATFSGPISNSGTVSAGNGLGFFSVATVTGGIFNSGTVAATNSGIFVSGAATFTGGISNSGVVIHTGGFANTGIGITSLGTFSGGVTNSGTITGFAFGVRVASASFIGGHIVNGGTITGSIAAIDVSSALNAITIDQTGGLLAGDVKLSPFGDTLNITGGAINGNVVGQNAGDTVNFALGGGTFTYASPFAMTGLSLVNINSGSVIVDGLIQATTIDVNGGSAGGTGTLAGAVTIMSGGTLMPGNASTPTGTLNVSGRITFNPGSTYAVHITPSTSSATSITGAPGTAVINGGIVTVTPQVGHYNATNDVIVATTGGRTGTFAGLTVSGPFTGSMTLDYSNPNDVLLDIGAGSALFAVPLGANQNQQNVLNAINTAILAGDNLPPSFANLSNLSNTGLLNALTQLSGENSAGFFQGAFQAGNSFLTLMVNPFLDGRFGGGFGPANGFASEEAPPRAAAAFASAIPVKAPPPPTFDQRFSAWGGAYGGSGNVRGDPVVGSSTTTASVAAFAAGMDYRASPDTTWGFALAGGGTNWSLDSALGGGRSDFFQAGLYGSQHWGNAYLSGALAYNFHDVTTNRTVTIAGTDMLTSRFQANGVGARIEGGYRYALPWMGITPYAAAQVQSIFLPSYGETATSGSNQFALNFASQTATTTRTELGAWLDHTTLLDRGASLTLYTKLAWAHDFGDTPSASAIFQSLPGSSFVVNGAAPARDGGLVTTGARYDLVNGWSFTAKFDGEFSQTTSIYSGTAMVRKMW